MVSIIRRPHPSPREFDLERLAGFGINVAFLSAAGIDMERGATCAAFHEAKVKKKAIALARENYLVVDTSKMGKLQRAHFAPVGAFKAIITEHGEMPADGYDAPAASRWAGDCSSWIRHLRHLCFSAVNREQ